MDEVTNTAVADNPIVENTPVPEAPKPLINDSVASPAISPAQDLRDIQALLVNGIFPGNVAPQIVKAFQMLEQMAQMVEKEHAKQNQA